MRKQIDKKTIKTILFGVGVFVIIVMGFLVMYWIREQNKEKMKHITQVQGIHYNVLKYVNLGDYKKQTISLKVTQDDLNAEIESLKDEHTQYQQIAGTVTQGDKIYARYKGKINGKEVPAAAGEDYIDIGSGDRPQEFDENIIGAKTGRPIVFTMTVPEGTYGNEEIDGKRVEYTVTAEYICGDAIVPKFDDAFVQGISKYKTTKDYSEYLKKKLLQENKQDKEDTVWAKILKDASVKKYPSDMMEEGRKSVLKSYYDMAKMYHCSRDNVFVQSGYKDEKDFVNTDLTSMAKDAAKENLVALGIARKEGLLYTKKQYIAMLADEYSYNKEYYKSKKEYERKNKRRIQEETVQAVVKKWLAKQQRYTY